MGKKVLAICYSQSGQLADMLDRLTTPLSEAGASVEFVRVEPLPGYPFPWTTDRFYSVMPDCVLGVTGRLAPFKLKETAYDLIVLGYQAWFLYPSIPVNTLLHDPDFRKVLAGTPVVTITGARNMWLNTFLEIKKMVREAGGRLVGNIALIDRHPNHISFITIFHWLLGGKKDRYLKIFPFPGVSAGRHREYGYVRPYDGTLFDEKPLEQSTGRAGPAESRQHALFAAAAGINGNTNVCEMGPVHRQAQKKKGMAGGIQILSVIFTFCCRSYPACN